MFSYSTQIEMNGNENFPTEVKTHAKLLSPFTVATHASSGNDQEVNAIEMKSFHSHFDFVCVFERGYAHV